MRLSAAIRTGAKMAPQAFWIDRTSTGATCAMEAAFDGAGLPVGTTPPSWATPFSCPLCGWLSRLIHVVGHLNDHHRWSREKIADWVETAAEPLTEREPCQLT